MINKATEHHHGSIVVHLNGQPATLAAGACTLADLLSQAGIDAASHATAVNGQFVPRQQRAQTPLHAGDAVMCFQAITGG